MRHDPTRLPRGLGTGEMGLGQSTSPACSRMSALRTADTSGFASQGQSVTRTLWTAHTHVQEAARPCRPSRSPGALCAREIAEGNWEDAER
jgi:hypothetical protein